MAYSQVEPKLFVEQSVGEPGGDLLDFNVRAGNRGNILGSVIGHTKMPDQWIVYLDAEGKSTAGTEDADGALFAILPPGLDIADPFRLALAFTRELSVGADHTRFEFMWNGTTHYMREIMVYPGRGKCEILNSILRTALVKGWDLEISGFLQTRHTGFKGIYAAALNRRLRKSRFEFHQRQ